MIVIGDRLSALHPQARGLMNNRDREAIGSLARAQQRSGATHLLVHAGYFHFDEAARMAWLLEAAQEAAALPPVIDTPSPHAARAALQAARHGQPILYGLTGQAERLEALGPIAAEFRCPVAATLVDENGVPESRDGRMRLADGMVKKLTSLGIRQGDILIDPVVLHAARNHQAISTALKTVRRVREEYPEAQVLAALSGRTPLERALLTMLMQAGARAFLFNTLDIPLMDALKATRELLGLNGSFIARIPTARA